jgi:hypothetical protein
MNKDPDDTKEEETKEPGGKTETVEHHEVSETMKAGLKCGKKHEKFGCGR